MRFLGKAIKVVPVLLFILVTDNLSAQDFPEMKGLRIIRDYPVYYPDNLWDYIDGAADNYLNYKFRELHIAEYAKGKKVLYKVEIYQHESPEYAFGIYSSERSPDYHFIGLGTQGYSEPDLVFFLKGSDYVKVMVMDPKKADQKQLMDLARRVESGLPGPSGFPQSLNYFPAEGKIANSERFLAGDFLGRPYLEEFYTAQYKVDEHEFTVFMRKFETADSVKSVLARYYEDVNKRKPDELQEGDYRFDDGYNGIIYLIWKDSVLFGFQNLDDEKVMRTMALRILDSITQ